MRPARLVRVMSQVRKPGRCRDCRQRIEFAVSADRGKYVPLNPDAFILRTEQNPTTGVWFDIVAADGLHFTTCGRRADAHAGAR